MNTFPFVPTLLLIFLSCLSTKAQDSTQSIWSALNIHAKKAYDSGQYQEAIDLATKATQQALDSNQDSLRSISLNDLGVFNIKAGKFKAAELALLEAVQLRKKILGAEHPQYYTSISNLSFVYKRMNRLHEAAALFDQLIQYAEKSHGIYSAEYARSIQDLAGVYRSLNRYEEAEKLYLEAIKIRKKIFGTTHPQYATVINNLGVLYYSLKQYKKALPLYEQTLAIDKISYGEKHPVYANSLSNLADLLIHTGEFSQAEPLILQAITIRAASLGKEHPHYSASLSIAANMYLEWKQYSKAFSFTYQAFDANSRIKLDSHQIKNDIIKIATEVDFIESQMAISTFIIYCKIYEELYAATQNIDFLKKRQDNLQAACLHLQKVQKELNNSKDKLKILKNTTQTAWRAMENAYSIYNITQEKEYLSSMITYAEYNKSAILSNALQSESALHFGEVPDSLIQLERKIKQALSDTERKLIIAKAKKDSSVQVSMQKQLIALHAQSEALKKDLQANYPHFAKLKYQLDQVKAKEIQENIVNKETALLEYFVFDTMVYLILIKQDELAFYPIVFERDELSNKIMALRKGLSDYKFILENPEKAFELYSQNAHYFYNKLLRPANDLLLGIKQLTIVTDKDLGHIPFEVLLKSAPNQSKVLDYKNLHYLIKDYSISYSYSAALLLENNSHLKQKNNGQLLAFSAHYSKVDSSLWANRSKGQQQLRNSLGALPAAEKEVQALEQQFGNMGAFFYQSEATEANFKKNAPNYAVLHLAMHGILNQAHPLLSSLVFSENGDSLEDNFLEAHEISHLQLNNDLIVLSACETGYGKFQQGEGVLSLARSFMYAGVPSLVVSLWQVNDGATALVMKYFYKNIANGMRKDEALRQAKLSYLQQVNGITAHPAFWSAFIQIGDSHPIILAKASSKTLWVIGIILSLIFLLIFFNNKKSKA